MPAHLVAHHGIAASHPFAGIDMPLRQDKVSCCATHSAQLMGILAMEKDCCGKREANRRKPGFSFSTCAGGDVIYTRGRYACAISDSGYWRVGRRA